jgi:hypothetical protein
LSVKQSVSLFFAGALGYMGIEVLARGHSHWTMGLTGGLCLLGMVNIHRRAAHWPLLARCAAGAALVTAAELAVGLTVNRLLMWDVWDYSDRWLNLWGQICPRFTLYWFLLNVPVALICDRSSIRPATSRPPLTPSVPSAAQRQQR